MDKAKLREFKRAPEQEGGHWVQKTVLRSNLAVEALAKVLGRNPTVVYKWLSPQDHERNFPLCYLPQLLEESGDLTILDELNAMFGRVSIQLNGNVEDTIAALRDILGALEKMKGK